MSGIFHHFKADFRAQKASMRSGLSLVVMAVIFSSFTVSCGNRKRGNFTPEPKPKPRLQSGDGKKFTPDRRTPELTVSPCSIQTPSNCGSVGSTIQIRGNLTDTVNGYVGEPNRAVKWGIVVVPADKNRVFAIYKAKLDFHGYSLQAVQPGSSGSTTIPVQQGAGIAIDKSTANIIWTNPPVSQGTLSFVVRDVTQCMARSAAEARSLCNEDSDQLGNFERTEEVPFKIARGILSDVKDEPNIWGSVAACLVIGYSKYSDSLNQDQAEIIAGALEGVTGSKANCESPGNGSTP